MTTKQYLDSVNTRYRSGISREHSYRGDLQTLLETLVPGVLVTNEPSRIACGAPDYILTRKGIPIGYIEAKDIGADLDNKIYNEQFNRYKASLPNLIITDYLQFRLFKDGTQVSSIRIGEIKNGKVVSISDNFQEFEDLIKEFSAFTGQTITSASKLAKMMAAKARLLATVIDKALSEDTKANNPSLFEEANSTLRDQLSAFREVLIHDITHKEFADIYAQTIAYGMFAARLYDPTLDDFSRQEAAELIPKSNPFLRKLFQYIAGYDLDDRIKWIVDALADVFRATDVAAILSSFGKATQQNDPIIHFYETFLAEYDPKLRKSRGVWYTPEPVVNFIVRAVDDILKSEFGLADGIADTSKIKIKVDTQNPDSRTTSGYRQTEQEVHKVQILDPAAGTGTFLAEVIKQIYAKFQGQEGIWSQYVEDHLIPRLNGFEILMASYAMAHLKLELLLRETGYKPKNEQRLRVYLTNSLEEYHPDTGTLFASWLSSEANEANKVKRDTPVMIVIGNPPYSISSSNKSEWIEGLIVSYKQGLNERNIQPLSDDYIKFLRFGQFFIDKTGEGILAFISNNTFLDGIIHRQMRRNLLESFDKTFILDLHGSTKKRESAPDGSKDENVFDIMQGVSINIFIKTRKSKDRALGDVYLANCWGKREYKYNFLYRNNLKSVSWEKINYQPDSYMFRKFSITRMTEYEKLLKITDLFPFKTSGVKTHDDANLVSHNIEELKDKVVSQYQYFDQSKVYKYSYRPFDIEYILYDTSLLGRSREKTIYHLKQDNIGLVLVAQSQAANLNYFDCVFVTNILTDTNMFRRGGPSIFPAYLYNRDISQGFVEQDCIRKPNLNMGVIATIAHKLDLPFTSEKGLNGTEFSTIDILDYVYATLHSPSYREKYKEFLKIDFPRIPYPKDKETFWQLVALGGELRQIHLLESPMVNQFITSYPIPGTNNVEKVTWDDYRVWINKDQYFDGVPVIAWEFYIGGYQPAQKWLKDRKGRELSYDDIRHYQKIIVALAETDRIMKEIDKISIE